MAKKTKKRMETKPPTELSRSKRIILLFILSIVGLGVIILTVITVIINPIANPGRERGVGANGFRAFEEQGTNLGIGSVVTKDNVIAALGNKAKAVKDVNTSNVFNLNGDRGQTATYDFTRADGTPASLYVDMMFFKSPASFEAAHVTTGTAKTNSINGHDTYYMHAQTLGNQREYRLLVIDGQKAYKFVIDQPLDKITITEVSALASLIKLAKTATL